MRLVNRLADAILTRSLRSARSTAGCPRDEWTEQVCSSNRLLRRTCWVTPQCGTACGSWRWTGVDC